jgi:hypothetical protein
VNFALTQDISGIEKVVLLAPTDMAGWANTDPKHQEHLAKAKQLIAENKGQELVSAECWLNKTPISAQTYPTICEAGSSADIYGEREGGALLGYEPLVRMSKGEKNGSERARLQILANAFEATIGSIYLDQGYGEASQFIHEHILSKLDTILEEGTWRDPKSHLQEVSQQIDGATPVYKVMSEEGPDHDKVFTLGAYVGTKLMGKGIGPSKQSAQQQAARAALKEYAKREVK